MTISPFTPLFFPGSNPSDGVPSRNVQTFAATDHIMVQVCVGLEETDPSAFVNNAVTGDMEAVEWQEWEMSDKRILFTVLTNLDPGIYTFPSATSRATSSASPATRRCSRPPR